VRCLAKYKVVEVPQKAWHGDTRLRLRFPDGWEVTECRMEGHNSRPLTDGEIRKAFANPIGSDTIANLAKGKKDVVIIVSDLQRPDPASRVVPFVLEELKKGGVPDAHIRFVTGLGTHPPLKREEAIKKVGEDMAEKYPIYNHNVYEYFTDLGKTKYGTPVKVNREVMECDLKIGIGGLIPHPQAGYSGGGKCILPAVSSFETIYYNHMEIGGYGRTDRTPDPRTGMGKIRENVVRFDMEEAARMAGLDVKVDMILNNRRQAIGVFVGDLVAEHREGVKMARKVYTTKPVMNADIVVTNAYPKDNQARGALWAANASVAEGGDAVLIAQSPEGAAYIGWTQRFGTKYGAKGWIPPTGGAVPKARKLLVYSEYLYRTDAIGQYGRPDTVSWHKTWDGVIEELKARHGDGARVAVYPYAWLQAPPYPEDW